MRIIMRNLSGATLLCANGLVTAPAAEQSTATLAFDTRFVRFQISPETGRCEISDKRASVTWRSNPLQPCFGVVTLHVNGKQQRVSLSRC